MAVSMVSHIEIGKYIFRNQVNSVEVTSGRKEFGDRAVIKLPNAGQTLAKTIKSGDKVLIKLGYDDRYNEEFAGYVSEVSPKIPVEVHCMDEMWQLRQQEIKSASWATIKLADLLKYIVPAANVSVGDITLAPFRINQDVRSRAEALQLIKDEFGLDVYFRSGQLYVGLAYGQVSGSVVFHFQKNAIIGDLAYKRAEDVRVKIKAISIDKNNQKIEVEVGDKDGEVHTLHFYNKTAVELKRLATEHINLMKYEGYRGSFKSKGFPKVLHGQIAKLRDDLFPERAGDYFIDGVKTTYSGSDGYSREITLGRKAGEVLYE